MSYTWLVDEDSFDEEGFRRMFRDNEGPSDTITTEGILEGYRDIKREILTDEHFEAIKRSPMYVRGKQ